MTWVSSRADPVLHCYCTFSLSDIFVRLVPPGVGMTTFKNGLAKHESGFYHYCFRHEGMQFKGSTRATDLATAKKVLEERRRQVINGNLGERPVPILTELTAEWLRLYRPVHSLKHWKNVELVTRKWIHPQVGRRKVDLIRTADSHALRSRMLEAGRSPVTVNDALKILKLLGNFAVKQGYIMALPFRVEFLKVQKKPRPIVPAAMVSALFKQVDAEAENPHVRVILRVMVGLGLRESEALGMRWEWFNLDNQTYTVGKAKGKEARVLPVPSWLWSAIHKMPKTLNPWVFPAEDGMPHRSQLCTKALRRVCKKLGLGNVTQHRLRATFATLHAEAGTPITEIQGMLGHKNIQTTMIYVEQSLGAKRKAQETLSRQLGLT